MPRGGAKARRAKARKAKEARLQALSHLAPAPFTGYVHASFVWQCGCREFNHAALPERPFDYRQPAGWTADDNPDKPRPLRGEGYHYEAEWIYVDSRFDYEDAPPCGGCQEEESVSPFYESNEYDNGHIYTKLYRRPYVYVNVSYTCGHVIRRRDQKEHGYATFQSPWEGAPLPTPLDCERPPRNNLTKGIHYDAEFTFEMLEAPRLCLRCEDTYGAMAEHMEDCLECFTEMVGIALEMESRSLGRA